MRSRLVTAALVGAVVLVGCGRSAAPPTASAPAATGATSTAEPATPTATAAPTSTVAPSLPTPRAITVTGTLELAGALDLTATEDELWVRDADSVHRIDRATLDLDETVRIPEDFGPFAIAGDAVWITAFELNELAAYSIATGKVVARIPVGLHPNVVFGAAGSVWGYNLHGRFIERVDPQARETAFEWDLPALLGPATTPLTAGAVWFGAYDLNRLIAIDPDTNEVAANMMVPIRPCGASAFPTFILGTECGTEDVVMVDAAGEVLATLALPGVPGGWSHVGGLAWTTIAPSAEELATGLAGFDPETLEPRDAVEVGAPIQAAVVAFDALWVSTDAGVLRFALSELGG